MTAPRSSWTAVSVRFSVVVDGGPVAAVPQSRRTDLLLDLASGALFELGAEGLEQRDGPPLTLVASFPPDRVPETLVALVQESLQALGVPVVDVTVTAWPDVDWATHWRRHYQPLSFGRVWVVPSWLEAPAEAEVVLRIDPQMAFGTGLHPTTAMCMRRVVELSPIDSLLDVGTGTGILSLAAVALGAKTVVATDIDAPSIEQARANAAANGLGDRVSFTVDGDVTVGGAYAVVVANILAEPLIRLAERIAARVAPRGRLILSGLLLPQGDAVEAAYVGTGLIAAGRRTLGEWVNIELTRVDALDPGASA